AVGPDGTKCYVANNGSNNVSVINTSNNTVSATITVGTNPYGVSVTPDGAELNVANQGSNNISGVHAGFSDQSQVLHHFKRLIAPTPGQFRTRVRTDKTA